MSTTDLSTLTALDWLVAATNEIPPGRVLIDESLPQLVRNGPFSEPRRAQ